MERKPRKSILDKYSDEISKLFEKPGVHKRAAYEYLLDKYGETNIGTYNNFGLSTSTNKDNVASVQQKPIKQSVIKRETQVNSQKNLHSIRNGLTSHRNEPMDRCCKESGV